MKLKVKRAAFLMIAAAVAAGGAFTKSEAKEVGRPPNVVLIFSDDQGTLDLNCYGSKDLHTPNLDRLAREGVRFTQFYTASPVCSPSRAALLTGSYPQRAGVVGNVSSRPDATGMPTEQVTLAEMLKGAGYRTALFGKWHLGSVPECDPLGQGFEQFFGHRSGCIDNLSHTFYWQGPPLHDLWRDRTETYAEGKHFSDLVVREAKRFLGQNRDRPFFLYLPLNSPHYPLQAQEKYRKLYAKLPEPRRAYAAMVSSVDGAVGEVLDRLDQLNLRENTLVVFLSDHGHSTEERANFGGGNAGPYRGSKFSMLEGGIRIPCIARFPGLIPTGEVRDQFAVSIDWYPTIAELCKVPVPDRPLDGRSLVPVLRSPLAASPHPVFHWQLGNQWAVRAGNWKLVFNAADTEVGKRFQGPDQLFLSDLSVDATERANRAAQHPDVVTRLRALHERWVSQWSAPPQSSRER